MIRAAAVVLLGAAPTWADQFDGLYKPAPTSDCTVVGGDGGALKVEDGMFFGAESQCRMTQPVNVRDMDAVLFDMVCGDEGDEWISRALFMTAADGGMILAWNGFAFKYDRCESDPAVGTVTTADDLGISN